MAERLTPQVRRARILDTALDYIEAHGHRSLTMAELARRCSMSAPGVMHYFPDIPHLLVAVVQRRDDRDREAVVTRHDDSVRQILDAIVANIAARPRAAQLFAMVEADALDPAHPGHEYFRDRAEQLARWLAPQLTGSDREARARRVFAVIDGMQLHHLRDPAGFDIVQAWADVADALLD